MKRKLIKVTSQPVRSNNLNNSQPKSSAARSVTPRLQSNSSEAAVKHTKALPPFTRPNHKKINETTTFLTRSSNRVFIVGGGPSLLNLNLEFLNSEDVICVNKAIDLVKNPKYFITMDYSFFNKIGSSVKHIVSRAQSSHFIINRQHAYMQNINGVYTDIRNNTQYSNLDLFSSVISSYRETNNISGFSQTIEEFSHGENSGYCAIQFAILAGYTKIYLLGFDLTQDIKLSQTHFHSAYPVASNNRFYQKINTYKQHLANSIAKLKQYKTVEIFTLTASSLEPLVPRVELTNITNITNSQNLNQTQVSLTKLTNTEQLKNLIIVAYYTINTPYEDEAKKLIKSLNVLDLNYDVTGVPNLGNWQANTRFKAKFMEDMLNKHQGKNLLYVDSDAIVHSKPVLFENYFADIAVRWQDFRWRKNECLSGTIFMANNDKTRELCQRWQRINLSEGPAATTFEQWNLGSVIKEMESEGKLITKNLPPEYTMIFDSMRAMYPNIVPVIEHFQASRKLKNKV